MSLWALLLASISQAQTVSPDYICVESSRYLASRLEVVRSNILPELDKSKLKINWFQSASDFFQTQPRKSDLFLSGLDRTYIVRANTRLCLKRPSESAIDAILAHELMHIRSYLEMNGWELIQLGVRYLAGSDANLEHVTDCEASHRGYSKGLKAYRLWLYTVLDPAEVAIKKQTYLTPEELDRWTEVCRDYFF